MAGAEQQQETVGDRGIRDRLGGALGAADRRAAKEARASIPVTTWPEPLPHANYIDRVAEAVSMDWGTYLVHWTSGGLRYSFGVPDQWIIREYNRTTAFDTTIHRTRQAALEALVWKITRGGIQVHIGFWSNEQVGVIVPTLFSDVSTPRIMELIEKKDAHMLAGAREAEESLKDLAKGMVIGAGLGKVARAVSNPEFIGYRLLDRGVPKTVPTATPASGARGSTISATGPPASGETSGTAPPVRGATSATRPPLAGSTTSSRAPLNELLPGYRAGMGEVLGVTSPPASVIATTVVGREREERLVEILRKRLPYTQLRFNFAEGPDVEWIGGVDPGFDILDLKPMPRPPDYDSYATFIRQVRQWSDKGWKGRQAPVTFRAAMCSYDPDGNFYIEDIGTVGPEFYTPYQQLARPPKPWKRQP
ncbi:hypothetical protein ACGFNY_44720 [Streptomyces chartreusis]|uniref:hypothetical protein n=1 Tax=Streptomyces chartreusis TaxID=1969 RepID=UPI003719F3E7